MEADRIISFLKGLDVKALGEGLFEKFYYQGFDPMKMISSLAEMKKTKGISDDEFGRDVAQMVAIGILKGSVTARNQDKMSDDGKAALKQLMSRYSIPASGGKNLSAKIITFPRAVATFPNIAARVVMVIGPKDFGGGPMSSSRLPAVFKFQSFPAVVPKKLSDDAKGFFLLAALAYSIDMTWAINQSARSLSTKQIAEDQKRFVDLSFNSPLPDDSERIKVFSEMKIMKDFERTSEVVKEVINIMGVGGAIPSKESITKELVALFKGAGTTE